MEIEMAARARNRFSGPAQAPFGAGMKANSVAKSAAKVIRPLCDLHH